jgi:hypothetical protein
VTKRHRGARYSKQTVVILSERTRLARSHSAKTLGALLARHARAGTIGTNAVDRPWKERPLGGDLG